MSIRAGFAHSNNPVPASTLSPLTAAIMTNQLSTGIGYQLNKDVQLFFRIDNVADVLPKPFAVLGSDPVGRVFRLGLRFQ